MIDYKQGAGQKRRLTIDYDATREAVAQAGEFVWGAWSELPRASRRFAAAALGLVGVGCQSVVSSRWP